MKILVVNTDYQEFLTWLYAQHPGLDQRTYEEQLEIRYASLFGVADFYSHNLRQCGHETHDIYANNQWLQQAWMRERGLGEPISEPRKSSTAQLTGRASRLSVRWPFSLLRRLSQSGGGLAHYKRPTWFYKILSRQIQHYRPDVILNQDVGGIRPGFWREMKPYIKLLVGQHPAIALQMDPEFRCYDLMISSFPPTLDFFRRQGLSVELSRLAFEPRILSRLPSPSEGFDVTVVASFHEVHSSRVSFLEALLSCLDHPERVKIWTSSINHLHPASPIRGHCVGPAWGRRMYEILGSSKMTINHHGDVPPFANNMRLYEATGVGTLLVTDWKQNLPDIFVPGAEVVAYHTPEECAGLIKYYLDNEEDRTRIAKAGQARTLLEHTYLQRMQELADVFRKYL